ncbi:NTP transferase domain-containing protein [Marinobacter salinexigens]|uniref:NTP transferase domain-containing protein n=1 Tax=Marinobacter salinexigens TaxID=2919747 RepID=A0A5B0VJG1_9GAMM|nr:NTP transferase domain-containing protein [Marinobacter salinexigens]KAA1174860.1 NTP transferase domain-containing protein [Marinobacter salinexigens]
MGRPKALLPLKEGGGVLLDRAIAQARVLSRDVRVVCGAWYPLIRFRVAVPPSAWLRTPDWHEGLSASIRRGLLSLGPEVKGVFILVADQPLLGIAELKALGKAARYVPNQPVAADYNGWPGVPAYLPRWLWPYAKSLDGDQGAGRLLAEVSATRVGIPGAQDDVDTLEDWDRIRHRLAE